jgi:beta-lactamase regulating signal transducer with metallopeptidase domain
MAYLLSFLKLLVFSTLSILLYEITFANYTSISQVGTAVTVSQIIDTSVLSVKTSLVDIAELQPLNLKSVSLAVWVFTYRFYYIVLLVVLLILYYKFRKDQLQQPTVTKKPKQSPGDYELRKQKLTEKSLKDLDDQLIKYY